ncbi:hypothetical protein [Nocardia sp. NPDC004123]
MAIVIWGISGASARVNFGDRGFGGEVTLRNWLNSWSVEVSKCQARATPAEGHGPDGGHESRSLRRPVPE